jgi:hypothetical protein
MMEGIEIIDNFLPKEEFETIKNFVFNGEIPLFYQHNTLPFDDAYAYKESGKSDELNEKFNISETGHPFFFHMFFDNLKTVSNWDSAYRPVLDKVEPLSIIRGKLNVNINTKTHISSGWHFDLPSKSNYMTLLYHLNDNNGYTLFEDGTKVKSVANRLIKIPGNLIHTGITQTDEPTRAFITFNYFEK